MRIMAKYTRGAKPHVIEGSLGGLRGAARRGYAAHLEGLSDTLTVQGAWDSKAANAKAEDFVDRRLMKI